MADTEKTKGDVDTSPTAMGEPQKKSPGRRYIVRVTFPPTTMSTGPEALVETRDGKIKMRVPIGMVQKRMRPNETVAYFEAWLRDHGILELADRTTEAKW